MATVTAPSVEAPPVEASPGPGWGAAMLAAGLVALARPALWPVALAAFLLRGGIVALALPLVILPSPTGVANVIMPLLSPAALGRITPTLVLVVVATSAALALAIVIGGLLGAWLDAELIREAAEDEELGDPRLRVEARRIAAPQRVALAGLAARLAAYAPFGLALAWGLNRLIGATYTELILPQDLSLPLAARVLERAPDAVAAIAVTWVLGEVLSGLALRHLVLDTRSVARALRAAIADLVRHPGSMLATTVLTDLALAVVAGVGVLTAAAVVERLRFGISVGGSAIELALVLILVAATWAAALLATGALTAFRSVAWTFELTRRGTIGDADPAQPGDWASGSASGRL